MRFLPLLILLATAGCATLPPTKGGILLNVDLGTPLEESDLRKHCGLGDSAACALAAPAGSHPTPPRFAILQGLASKERAVFAALVPKSSNLQWFAFDRKQARLWKLSSSRPVSRENSAWAVQRIEVRDISPDRSYELLAGDPNGQLLEDRLFRSLNTDSRSPQLAAIHGLRSEPSASVPLSDYAPGTGARPDLLLLLGDNASVRLASPSSARTAKDQLFEQHVKSRLQLSLAKQELLLPSAATWSETEFGQASGDRSFPYRDQAREIFELFFPHWADEKSVIDGPGLAKAVLFPDHLLALLDDRSFRSPAPKASSCPKTSSKGKAESNCPPKRASESADPDAYGILQQRWLAGQIHDSQRPVWLASGIPWLGRFDPKAEPSGTSAEASLLRKGVKFQLISLPPLR